MSSTEPSSPFSDETKSTSLEKSIELPQLKDSEVPASHSTVQNASPSDNALPATVSVPKDDSSLPPSSPKLELKTTETRQKSSKSSKLAPKEHSSGSQVRSLKPKTPSVARSTHLAAIPPFRAQKSLIKALKGNNQEMTVSPLKIRNKAAVAASSLKSTSKSDKSAELTVTIQLPQKEDRIFETKETTTKSSPALFSFFVYLWRFLIDIIYLPLSAISFGAEIVRSDLSSHICSLQKTIADTCRRIGAFWTKRSRFITYLMVLALTTSVAYLAFRVGDSKHNTPEHPRNILSWNMQFQRLPELEFFSWIPRQHKPKCPLDQYIEIGSLLLNITHDPNYYTTLRTATQAVEDDFSRGLVISRWNANHHAIQGNIQALVHIGDVKSEVQGLLYLTEELLPRTTDIVRISSALAQHTPNSTTLELTLTELMRKGEFSAHRLHKAVRQKSRILKGVRERWKGAIPLINKNGELTLTRLQRAWDSRFSRILRYFAPVSLEQNYRRRVKEAKEKTVKEKEDVNHWLSLLKDYGIALERENDKLGKIGDDLALEWKLRGKKGVVGLWEGGKLEAMEGVGDLVRLAEKGRLDLKRALKAWNGW